MIDLHTHTTFSDGQYTPEEVVQLASKAGVSVLAITDHDTVDGVERGKIAADIAGIRFVSGIEISCAGNKELHLLGYNIDIKDSGILSACEAFSRFRIERAEKIINYLDKNGLSLTLADVVAAAGSVNIISRSHFALAMMNKGYVKTTREAFDRYLGTPEFDVIERPKPTASEGIDMILASGGVPVLAHPIMLKLCDEKLESMIQDLASCGLRGLECHYSANTKSQTALYCLLAQKYGLLITGGSDFHGEKYKPNIKIGTGIDNSLLFNDNTVADALFSQHQPEL